MLLDLAMPGVRGFSGLMYMRAQYPGCRSSSYQPMTIRPPSDVAWNLVLPDSYRKRSVSKRCAPRFRVCSGGGVWTPPDVDLAAGSDAEAAELMTRMATLTPQQVRVLMMLSEGLLNKQIALSARCLRSDGEGTRVRDFAEARC